MTKLLGNLKKGLTFIVSAPAGTGKTTLVRMLMKEFSCIRESVSFTTRKKRPSEVEGKDYHFVSQEVFDQKLREGEFLEHAHVFGNFYATSAKAIDNLQKAGDHVILVIDTQGAMQLKNRISAIFIFVSPPSLEALKLRLEERGVDSRESMEQRLSWAQKEMALKAHYDYHIVNDDLHLTYQVFRSIFIAEEHKNR